jgi:hypothetical protein
MELAGLEPATSWVRSVSGWGMERTRGDGRAESGADRLAGFPASPLLYSQRLTESAADAIP